MNRHGRSWNVEEFTQSSLSREEDRGFYVGGNYEYDVAEMCLTTTHLRAPTCSACMVHAVSHSHVV